MYSERRIFMRPVVSVVASINAFTDQLVTQSFPQTAHSCSGRLAAGLDGFSSAPAVSFVTNRYSAIVLDASLRRRRVPFVSPRKVRLVRSEWNVELAPVAVLIDDSPGSAGRSPSRHVARIRSQCLFVCDATSAAETRAASLQSS